MKDGRIIGRGQNRVLLTGIPDTSRIGFDDKFQYLDFRLPWEARKAIKCFPDFERAHALMACEAWEKQPDRHPY